MHYLIDFRYHPSKKSSNSGGTVHTFGTHSFLIPPIHHRDIFFWKIAAVILKTAHDDEPKTVPPLQKIDNSCYRVEPNTRFGVVQDTAAGNGHK